MKLQKIIFFLLGMPLVSLCAQNVDDSLFVVKEIRISGNDITKEYVIRREMKLHAGDTLRQEIIKRDKDRIYNLGLFNKVDIEYSVEDRQATVFVTVSERWYLLPYPVLGMKYHDLSKLYYGVSALDNNFRGANEKILAQIAFGYDRWIGLTYQNPKLTSDDDIYFSSSIIEQKVHNLSPSYGEYLNNNFDVSETIGKRFGYDQTFYASAEYQVWLVNDALSGATVTASGRDAFPDLVFVYRYDTRNDIEYATRGTLIALSFVKYGYGDNAVNTVASTFDIKHFIGIGEKGGIGFRALGSFEWGGLIPPYQHFFFGYSDRIRGYFNTIFEGEDRLGGTMELRLPLLSPQYYDADYIALPGFRRLRYGIYFSIFADAGTTWYRNQVLNQQPIYSGYGAGIHFLLPYGFTIRTEAAINNRGEAQTYIDFDTSF
ncbi:MAG: POTRA domain-containing protein [Bacteroidota bacterium]